MTEQEKKDLRLEDLLVMGANYTHENLTKRGLTLYEEWSDGTRLYQKENILYVFDPAPEQYRYLIRCLKSDYVERPLDP